MSTKEMMEMTINSTANNAEDVDNNNNLDSHNNPQNENNEKLDVIVNIDFEQETKQNDKNNEQNISTKPGHTIDPSIHLDRPTIFSIPDEKENEKTSKFFNKDVKVRLSRWIFIAFAPCVFLFVLTYEDHHGYDLHLSFLIGIGILIMYLNYFALIGYLFYSGSRKSKGRSLFRVWTRSQSVPGWASMSIATHQKLYEFQAIQSISEFSAIDGGAPSFMLSNLGPFTWAVVTMHFASELQCNPDIFGWDIADYMEIIGVCGLVMIGMFELDPYNPPMKFFHYLGAICGVGTIVGYFIQQVSLMEIEKNSTRLVLPIMITLIASTCFILWQFVFNGMTVNYQNEIMDKYIDNKPNDEELKIIKAKITRLSLQNVISEGIFLFCGAASLSLWLMDYDNNCKLGCAGLHK